jgi:hypothetical protein
MAYAFVGSPTAFYSSGGASASLSYSPTVGNTLLVAAVTNGAGSGLTLSDGSNTYNYLGTVQIGGIYTSLWWANVTTGGSLTISLSGTSYGLQAWQYSGLATSAYIASSFQSQGQGGLGVVNANILTTTSNPNVTTAPAMLWGLSVDISALTSAGTAPAPNVGTGSAYTGRTVGWLGGSSQQVAQAEDIRETSTGTAAITFGTSNNNQYDNFATIAVAFAEYFVLPLAVRQACVVNSAGTAVFSETAYFAEATLAGSTIFVVAKGSTLGGNAFTGFSDAVNGAYTSLDFIKDTSAFGIFQSYMLQNAASIGTANGLTISASASEAGLGFVAYEIQGASASSLAAHAAGLQTLATGAANAIISPTVQAGIGSALAVAVSINDTQQNTTYEPAVGTGFTICPSPGANFWLDNAIDIATGEYQLYTNPGGIAATFTPPGATSDDYVTFIAVFNSIGGAFVPPFTATQFFVNDQYIQS